MWSSGYLTVLRFRGIPVRVHWSTPIGAFFVGRFHFVPGVWLGFVILVLLHEAGHALVVKKTGNHVLSIEASMFGGACTWAGTATAMERALIAWGGVWAQMAAGVVAWVLFSIYGAPSSFWMEMAFVFTEVNLWMMLLNLIPLRPLDGAEAWTLVGLLRERRKLQRARSREAKQRRAREDAVRRLAVVEVARKESRAMTAMDEVDDIEHGVTPEVEAVLDRARTIAAEEGERELAERAGKKSVR